MNRMNTHCTKVALRGNFYSAAVRIDLATYSTVTTGGCMRAVLMCFALSSLAVQAGPLNDTGIDFCGAASSGNAACDGSQPAGQDAHYGRDAHPPAKIGGGGKGFDFTALDAAGNPTTPGAHACTRDNVTGLWWEVKVNDVSHLRHMHWFYAWYDSVNYGGDAGTPNSGVGCKQPGRCDTEKFVVDVNASALCGKTDWRMPTVKELVGIVDFGRSNQAIDPAYFPNTPNPVFWSGSPNASGWGSAWYVNFSNGDTGYTSRNNGGYVRLVRGGQ
jgi:hypothetical protein